MEEAAHHPQIDVSSTDTVTADRRLGEAIIGALKADGTTEVVEHRSGGDPSTAHKSPGRQKYDAITLERGLTQDLNFHDWAGRVWNFGAGLG